MTMTEQTPEERLAGFAANLAHADIPESVLHEAKRSLVNIFATALAGSAEPAVEIALATMGQWSGPATSSLVGRPERTDSGLAAFLNAMAANIFDFDDTHEATIIHPAAMVFAAAFAHAETVPCTGKELLRAYVIGGEIECRMGNAATPWHYARGWHITSTCGVFGAAVAIGALMRLDQGRMLHALGSAAVQTAGLVEALGTMSKSVSVGNGARNGMLAAALAARDFTGPPTPLTGERGWLRVHAETPDIGALTDGLGTEWEIAKNTYKPYPVGVVLNPVLDACLDLRAAEGLTLGDVAQITLTGHPLLRQRTDRPDVRTGRQSQVSAQHAIAIALMRGRAGLDEFSDTAVAETWEAGRPEIAFNDEAGRDVASVGMSVRTNDGRTLTRTVDASRGSRSRPLTDRELEEKLETLAARVGFAGTGPLIEALWSLGRLDDAGAVMRLARTS